MGKFMLKLPSMGESVTEATLTAWLKEVGDTIEIDDSVLEVATDKVDSDVPSDVAGTLVEKRFNVNDVIQVGDVIAVIESAAIEDTVEEVVPLQVTTEQEQEMPPLPKEIIEMVEAPIAPAEPTDLPLPKNQDSTRFYSPLVRNIAAAEGISAEELETIPGTGESNRVTKKDIFAYLEDRVKTAISPKKDVLISAQQASKSPPPPIVSGEDQIIEMSRMGKLISNHMTESKNTSVHVQSYVEADVTDLWDWREKTKGQFQAREGEKLTFTPIFISAIIHALKEFPLLNSSVNGDQIIQKRSINIGMATALGDGNLIVPVIKKADHLNLVGLAKAVNDLSNRARLNQLQPEEVQGGTYTFTNIGNFGSITGTPIINQPQVGIIALGVIRKMPAVIETADGDFVGIRRKIILSHSYDHRIINGAMGGQFVKAVANYLEQWDTSITF
ncbi:2-oxo acid dehydrogenase subunit E2 [Flavobacteriaceae bacterium]|nr:2-oxo acid dehydrogenase subunit E2 [Flavobacteriaceae bacterium]MDA9972120.1 2-oxo acid dehydrogenase subunit E2 [Flavobacteriaceae bacterium]MDB4112672.1 2-oxo acid dehydrogenase subunit E2 [Flavobacteriaceae bacterium]MDB4118184.1 2-oxo acid dehydrogenase subunit E2 [Flavobacteriaceae bacterium]MDB4186402.1 2-oxo acid dehydrogenase subunit E2 [Flavobacteriaceae bacterium]